MLLQGLIKQFHLNVGSLWPGSMASDIIQYSTWFDDQSLNSKEMSFWVSAQNIVFLPKSQCTMMGYKQVSLMPGFMGCLGHFLGVVLVTPVLDLFSCSSGLLSESWYKPVLSQEGIWWEIETNLQRNNTHIYCLGSGNIPLWLSSLWRHLSNCSKNM